MERSSIRPRPEWGRSLARRLTTSRLVQTIAARRAQALVDDGTFDGGIVPKLLAAASAVRSGVAAEIGVTAVTA